MEDLKDRLKRLTETEYCNAEAPEEYCKELLELVETVADTKMAKKQSKFFKALADEKRLRIIKLLMNKEMCICELMVCIDTTQPNLSHHVEILENAGIVKRKKKGKWAYCSIADKTEIEKLRDLDLL
ncbi:MAG: winged helix-turn-helix transcriptional regulator [Candidatus Bathyarchaeota archaeon]|nr:metalloregulator ArsR/SmtB family transcription factor [Candidatus Bathyarchaeum tardum]WGM89800.1 MAG: metalloregulator ArsR/SmtB family transcription factor [Candidatus Bathyarchaeum tardum]WNZ30102.1 MAG: winged helix-turn-helix transcriptional regulator [Candidatus Bathyarchaeota archaeon]